MGGGGLRMPCHHGCLACSHIPRCISHQLCSCQLLRQQQLKDGISSIAVILGLSSMTLPAFVPVLTLFKVQNGVYGNVGVWLELVVCACGGAIISVGIEK